MARGGRRVGAGRKAGAVTTRTRAIADQAAKEGKTPLEVMLENMRHFAQVAADAEAVLEGLTAAEITGGAEMSEQDQFNFLLAKVKQAAGLRELAQDCARDAAPFMHPRLSPIEPGRKDAEFVPLAERLKAYARDDAIKASEGKVVELPKKKAGRR
jgi:hypothetical protein